MRLYIIPGILSQSDLKVHHYLNTSVLSLMESMNHHWMDFDANAAQSGFLATLKTAWKVHFDQDILFRLIKNENQN